MVKQTLTGALVKSILQVLDRVGPTGVRRHWRPSRRHGRRGAGLRWPMPGATMDLDRFHRIRGDPGTGTSHQAPNQIPNPRVSVLHRPPSPSPEPPAYWPMEPSDTTTSPRGHREPPCAIHGSGPCPYPVALRRSVLSSPSLREGGEEGEEGVAAAEGVNEVAVAVEDDDDDLVEVIPVPASPARSTYKQMTRIRIGPRGRPTGTLASRTGAREVGRISPKIGSEVWPLPPPPPPNVAMTPSPPPPQQQDNTTPPPLLSPVGGHILRRFAHLANPSHSGHRPGAWELPHRP
jgi:hypothetical protein